MTEQERQQRYKADILRRVSAAGMNGINLRRLKRAMSYHRAPDSWDRGFDELQTRKQIAVEWSGAEDNPNASGIVFTPVFKAAREAYRGVSSSTHPATNEPQGVSSDKPLITNEQQAGG